jgi:hypothetical protein
MPGKAIKLGPFKGGINNVGEASTLADNQLAAANNFDIDSDGSLVSRPAIVYEVGSPGRVGSNVGTNLATNPRVGVNLTGWSNHSGAGTGYSFTRLVTGAPPAVVSSGAYARVTFGSGALASSGIFYTHLGITGGIGYSFSVYAREYMQDQVLRLRIIWQDSSGANISNSFVDTPVKAGVFSLLTLEGLVSPSNATRALVSVIASGGKTWTNGTSLDVTGVFVSQSGSLPSSGYFDGGTANAGSVAFGWSGTADASTSTAADTNGYAHFTAFGYYVRNDGETFLVGTIPLTATTGAGTWIYQISSQTWTKIWSTVASDFCQYDNKIVLCSGTGSGGYWENGAFTATTSMPAMDQIVVYGERFWGYGPKTGASTTVYFSNLTVISPAQSIYDWQPTSNFFTVGKGDGQWITSIVADPNALLIFRNASTYQFTYPTSPITGTLRKLNGTVGADNKRSVVLYENYYFVLNGGFLYQFINYLYYPRNVSTVRFVPSSTTTLNAVGVSVFGQRVIVFYYGSLYVYNVVLGIWTTWSNAWGAQRFLQIPASSTTGQARQALIEGALIEPSSSPQAIRRITDATISPQSFLETFVCYAKTKTYNFDDGGIFKRMMYWAVSFKSSSGIIASVTPVDIVTGSTTWNDLDQLNWSDLDQGSWNNPTTSTPTIMDNIAFPLPAPQQALAKVQSRIRFKSAYFEVEMKSSGVTTTAPARIFGMTAYLKEHMRARSKVS